MVRLDSRQVLETSLLDSRQLVTITYLSRHAEIPVSDAINELQSFYVKNKSVTELHAVYVVSGEVKKKEDGSQKKRGELSVPVKCRCTQLVREEDLERLRKKFEVLDTCQIYCLHTKPIKSLLLLYNVDHLEDESYALSDPERSWLCCPAAEVKRAAMYSEHPDSAKLFEKTVKAAFSKPSGKARGSRTPSPKGKKGHDEKYANACAHTRLSPQKKSPKSRQSKEGKPKESPSTEKAIVQEETKKPRGGRIILSEEVAKKKVRKPSKSGSPHPVAEKENSNGNSESEAPPKGTEKKTVLSNDDVFSDGNSSAEEPMEVVAEASEDKQEVTPPAKKHRLPNAEKTATSKQRRLEKVDEQQTKKATRTEYVTETFVDEDGFMVTKEVLKEVEVPLAEKAAPPKKETNKQPSPPEKDSAKTTSKRSAAKKGLGTQSKISAFFKK